MIVSWFSRRSPAQIRRQYPRRTGAGDFSSGGGYVSLWYYLDELNYDARLFSKAWSSHTSHAHFVVRSGRDAQSAFALRLPFRCRLAALGQRMIWKGLAISMVSWTQQLALSQTISFVCASDTSVTEKNVRCFRDLEFCLYCSLINATSLCSRRCFF